MRDKPGRRSVLASIALLAFLLPHADGRAASPPDNPVHSFAGRYSTHFRNGMVGGDDYWSDNVAEIVPLTDTAAYIRVSLEFYNGHTCDIWGIGQAEGARLVYHDPDPPTPATPPHCTLSLSRRGPDLLIDDNEGTCKSYCGMRGSLMNQTLPFASRRPITYMKRLRDSRNYQEALAAWKTHPAR